MASNLELIGANPFRVNAYTKVARVLKLKVMDIPGLGPKSVKVHREQGGVVDINTLKAKLKTGELEKLPSDVELLRMARRDAAQWVKENPKLTGPRDALLRKRLLKQFGDMLGLSDVA